MKPLDQQPASGLPQEWYEQFVPFPVDALPEPASSFVVTVSKSMGCDPCYVALPLLTALAAAIGNTRRIELKRGWTEPAILWTAIIGKSGTLKSPAFKLVMHPIYEREGKSLQLHAGQLEQYQNDLTCYERSLTAWRRSKSDDLPPAKPERPEAARFIVGDTTIEALAPLLLANPRGLLLAREELAGWIGSFDRYSSGKGGADSASWLSMHSGESIVVDRKTGEPRTIFVPNASVWVTGGIQPAILRRVLGAEHRESGLAARLLMVCPPWKPKRWTEDDIPPGLEATLARLLGRLYELQPAYDADGNPQSMIVGLTPEAKALWIEFYNSHASEAEELNDELCSAWSKLEAYAARLALVIHCTRWAADDPRVDAAAVDAESMAIGLKLVDWLKTETRRVYAMLWSAEIEDEAERLASWIERKGGSVTAREVQMGCRWLRERGAATEALEQLVQLGLGEWVEDTAKGRTTRAFVLSVNSQHDNATTECQPAVDVDNRQMLTVDTPSAPYRCKS